MDMKGICHAAIFLATAIPAAIAQPSTSTGSVSFSSSEGGQVSVVTTGNGRGFATVTVGGRTKTIGATSMGNGTAENVTDIDDIRGPPVMTDVEDDPTAGVPAPPVVSPPTGPPSAGEEGMARLVDRVDSNGYATGTLQVFCEGAWGAVCSSNFDDQDARVACRQLGFTGGVTRSRQPTFSRFNPDPVELAPFVLENLGCVGNESSLLDCPVFDPGESPPNNDYGYFDYGLQRCDPFRDTFARIACGTSDTASDGDLRLANGVAAADGSAEYGRLEIFFQGGWGTICDNAFINRFRRTPFFTEGSADVACRELGYKQGFQIQRLEDAEEDSTERVPIVLAGAQCQGSEATLAACPGPELGNLPANCRHNADVHLVCFSGPNPEMDGATRLVDGSADPAGTFEYGRLEIFSRGFWSNVCNNGRFTPDAAQVACKALGYDGGAALRFTQSYARSLSPVLFENLPVALAAVDCNGTEAAISECQSNDNLIGDCNEITSSTVLACANTAAGCDIQDGRTEGSVRLRGGFGTPCDPVHSGFIEVLHFGEWGSICTLSFNADRAEDNLVADVVCRQLGFPHGTRVDPLTARAPPDEDEAMSPYSYYYYSYYDTPTEEAEEPVERFWLNSVACSGPETALIQCDLGAGFLENNAACARRSRTTSRVHIACRQFPVVEALEELQTPGAESGDLRLIDQGEVENWTTGRLQVFFEGSWSQVCNTNFNAADANVACRQLGFGVGTVVPQALSNEELEEFRRTNIYPEIAIIGSGCKGSEERLVECNTTPLGDAQNSDYYFDDYSFSRDCLNSRGDGLVIGCVTGPLLGPAAGTEGAFRLTNKTAGGTPGSETGILEVFHAGAWGTLCDGDFGTTESTGEVACRGMGFATGVLQDVLSSTPVLPPWLSGIRCPDGAAELGACFLSDFGETLTCGPTKRLVCITSNVGTGEARLVGGSADPGGAWEYGVLEVQVNGVFNVMQELGFRRDRLGRRGAQVACRSLGFATGGQLLVGDGSPFPAPVSALRTVSSISCDGSEEQLGDCDIEFSDYLPFDSNGENDLQGIVSVVCTTPSGCKDPATPPAEGDVRLVPLNGTAAATAACDDVHFGGVELFREGRWGRICSGRFGDNADEFTLDAQVVCRQLGFPFGTVMDNLEVFGAYDGQDYFEDPDNLVWASDVVCTGKEDRLLDCVFPQNFGVDYVGRDYRDYYYEGFYNENWPAPSHAAPEPAPEENSPAPSNGLAGPRCSRAEDGRLAVICRRFEIAESNLIRR